MADKKVPKFNVLYRPYFGADPLIHGAGLTKDAAEKYVNEMKPAQGSGAGTGSYEIVAIEK